MSRSVVDPALCLAAVLSGLLSLSGVAIEPDARKVDPLVAAAPEGALRDAQAMIARKAAASPSRARVFIRLAGEDDALPEKVRALAGEAARIHPRLYTAEIPQDAVRYVSNWPRVAYIEASRPARPLLDLSRPAVSADIVQNGTGLPASFTGAGIYIGFVDTGLSNAHPDFHVSGAASPSRVVQWLPSPAIAGVDADGHGTHIAGIAAGNGIASGGTYTGMAPRAGLLIAKTTFDTVDIVNAVSSLISLAGTTPVVINLSLGLPTGPHDGTSAFESGINALAEGPPGSRRIVAAAAGNERTEGGHFRDLVPPFGSAAAELDFASGIAVVDIFADGGDSYAVTASLVSGSVPVESGTFRPGESGHTPGRLIFVSNGIAAPPGGTTFIQVTFSPPPGMRGAIRLDRVRNGGSGRIDGYVDSLDARFAGAEPSGTITEPANGAAVLAAGSFVTKNAMGRPANGEISPFSSLGPTRDGRQKPDLAAPGQIIDSARSPESPEIPLPGAPEYTDMVGTSMSSAHTAGIAALVWESNPGLTGAQMRERLKRTALPVPPAPNETWGFGKINALRAVQASVAAITAPALAPPGRPITLSSERSSGPFGAALAFTWSLASAPPGSTAGLPATGGTASFTPDIPGDYTVSLEVGPDDPARASASIRVNTIPAASVTAPASDNAGKTVVFRGTAADPDGQPLSRLWILVSRPPGSAATLAAGIQDNVTFTPDVDGTYEVGLRADDGLNASPLAVAAYTTLGALPGPSSGGGGGGGGCSAVAPAPGNDSAAVPTMIVLFAPPFWLLVRRGMRPPRK